MLPSSVDKACREVIVPLIKADGGEVYIVSFSDAHVHLHLSGVCSGCPGFSMTESKLVRPALLHENPHLEIRVSNGFQVPDGAVKLV